MKARTMTAVGFAALLLTSSVFGVVGAAPDETTTQPEPTGDWTAELTWYLGLFELSDDQVDAIVAEAERMHDDGATAHELRHEVVDSLRQYGVDEREIREKAQLRVLYELKTHYDLTDAQLDELTTMVVTMYEDGEAIPEIKHAIVWQLQDYGVDTTDLEERMWQARYDHLLKRYDLTESEAQLILDDARALFEDGATWDDIQDSVRSHLREFDARRVDNGHWRDKLQHVKKIHDLAHRYGLSGEEVRDVVSTAREMKADGASNGEIRAAVGDMDRDYASTNHNDRLGQLAERLQANFPLTDGEVRDIVSTVQRLQENGADREKIERVVKEKVKAYTADDRREHDFERLAKHLSENFPLSHDEVRRIVTMAEEMHENGADRAEIKQAVRERVKDYTADDRKKAVATRVAHHLHSEYDLSREEVKTVLREARDLRNDGASWAEVREYITDRAAALSGDEMDASDGSDDADGATPERPENDRFVALA
ncbi:hypothetical protein [Haloarchaeobius sp. DT45]|uniref:hypothetical protein n=1 Tax=Haloarchaeobius sp. DT45 TaxID=3446116 RepID=UPI003F6A9438